MGKKVVCPKCGKKLKKSPNKCKKCKEKLVYDAEGNPHLAKRMPELRKDKPMKDLGNESYDKYRQKLGKNLQKAIKNTENLFAKYDLPKELQYNFKIFSALWGKNKLKKGLDIEVISEVYNKFANAPDDEFQEYIDKISKVINFKIKKMSRYSEPSRYTVLKFSLQYVINSCTHILPVNRVKAIEEVFPLLKRMNFNKKLNKLVYRTDPGYADKHFPSKKFKFKLSEDIPKLNSIIDVALYFNTSVNVIMSYCFTPYKYNRYERLFERNNIHYSRKLIPKKDKLYRLISMPKYQLKIYQRKILDEILSKAVLSDCCTGFIKGKSVIDNASPHLNANLLVKIDLHRFFPSLKFYHVFEVFRGLGYTQSVSGILSCMCTDFYHSSSRFTPQGAPTSPMIGNLYASRLDARLNGLWTKQGFKYTRYADDITCSSSDKDFQVGGLIYTTYEIIKNENLYPNFKKTKVYRKGNRMEVTGITVNEKININRKWVNRLRGELHNYSLDGFPQGEEGITAKNQIAGKLSYLKMVNPEKASKYIEIFNKIQ